MELEDLAKKIDWLEREHRKDRNSIADLQEKLNAYEGNFTLLQSQINELNSSLSRYSSITARLDQFDKMVTQYRSEVTRTIDEVEKRHAKHEQEVENRHRSEVDALNKSIIEVRSSVDGLQELRKAIQSRVEEDSRLGRQIAELDKKLGEFTRADEDQRRSIRLIDEARKNDIKRITDVQGELSAIRKRADEAREKSELNGDGIRHMDGRVNELLASEADRRQAQMVFIEQQNLAQVDRERAWKDWQSRFDAFIRQTSSLDSQLASLEETQRAVKRSQDAFDDINVRLERRINEITEIQRLAEDRFRQEWVTFKADDQKRWTNYSLTQDEVGKDIRAELEKLNLRITSLDDVAQTLQDLFQQTHETTETQLQELMNWTHEFLTNHQRITGSTRPTR
jgi:predicted  nucleic acid-binding Zn-ribbon protein